jgi:outer membrane receptor for ferrienterochelin and colicin
LLETIVVKSEPLSVKTLIDRKVYSVTSDIQSSFGALSDILVNIPSVSVDADGNVSLRGDTNVLILVDGKPSAQFSGASAAENLQSFPAKDIERIEILTTPPPEFQAQGTAGIINVITRKRTAVGLTGSVQGSFGNGGRTVDGGNASYQSGPLTLTATAAYRHDFRDLVYQSDVIAPSPITGEVLDSKSSITEVLRRSVPTASLSATYEPNDRQSFTASATWHQRSSDRYFAQSEEASTAFDTLVSSSQANKARHDVATENDDSFRFTQKLSRPGEMLELAVSRWTQQFHEHYDYTDDPLFPPSEAVADDVSINQKYESTDIQADYTLPLSKTSILKMGCYFDQDDFHFGSLGNDVEMATGEQFPDPGNADDFKYRLQIYALYASYQATRGSWAWQSGLRAELTRNDTKLLNEDAAFTGSYLKIFPNLHVDYVLSDKSTLSLGASSRVTRPDADNLNPYIDREFTPNLHTGNPSLAPGYTQSYELGYVFEASKLTYSLTVYDRRNQDSRTSVSQYLGDGLTLSTPVNLPNNDASGLEMTANGSVGAKLTYSVSGDLVHSQIDANGLGIPGLRSTTGFNAKARLDYRLTIADSGELAATRTDRILTPQGYVGAINIVNVGYKHQFLSNLTAVATVSDMFNGQRYRQYWSSPGFTEYYLRETRGRIAYLGLVYSFGVKKDKKPKFDFEKPS